MYSYVKSVFVTKTKFKKYRVVYSHTVSVYYSHSLVSSLLSPAFFRALEKVSEKNWGAETGNKATIHILPSLLHVSHPCINKNALLHHSPLTSPVGITGLIPDDGTEVKGVREDVGLRPRVADVTE